MNQRAEAQLASAEQMLTLSFLILIAVAALIVSNLRSTGAYRRPTGAVSPAQPKALGASGLTVPVDAPVPEAHS
jgi:hypothetical protein